MTEISKIEQNYKISKFGEIVILPHLDLHDFGARPQEHFLSALLFQGAKEEGGWRQGGTLNDDFLIFRKSKVVSNQ